MKLKAWQGVPKPGQRQYYRDRVEWRRLERLLPAQFQIGSRSELSERFENFRGWDIHLDVWQPESSVATIVVCHGGGGNGRLVGHLAPALVDRGVRVVCPDLPGYGLTIRRPSVRITYNLWADIVADIVHAEAASENTPVHVMGLSLGGLLAYGAAMRCRREAVAGIVATTLLDTRTRRNFVRAARSTLVANAGYATRGLLRVLASRLTLPMTVMAPMKLITNDPLLSAIIASDPISGGTRAQLGFLLSLVDFDIRTEPEEADIPLLVTHPGLDPWTQPDLSIPFFERYGGKKRWIDLEGCGHFPLEEPGFRNMIEAIAGFADHVQSE